MEPNKGGGLGSIIMLLTFLVGGVALENQVSLQGSRPINKDQIHYHRPGDQNVDARLWEDPFQAVNQYQKRLSSSGVSIEVEKGREENLKNQINSRKSESITLLGVLVSSGPYFVDAENRRRTRYAVLSGLATAKYHPENSEYIGYLSGGDELFHGIGVFKNPIPPVLPYEWFESEKGKGWVLVFWLDNYHFFQKPSKKSDDSLYLRNREGALKRIRQLFNELAIGNTNEKRCKLMGSTSAPDLRQAFEKIKKLIEENNLSSISSEAKIQIQELLNPFTQAKKNDKILCRLNSQWFSTKIKPTAEKIKGLIEEGSSSSMSKARAQIKILFGNLTHAEKNEKIRYQLIGPTGSTYLMEMVKNANKLVGTGSNSIEPVLEIYSTRATKDEDLILKPESGKKEPSNKGASSGSKNGDASEKPSIRGLFKNRDTNISFLRTTPTDYHLAQVLVRDLKLRGIERCDKIGLISEWDTDYGRAFQNTMKKAWEEEFPIAPLGDSEGEACLKLENIYYFSYLQGLDGEIPESTSSSPGKAKGTNPLNSKEETIDFSSLRAEKERQYDYLIRLTGKIEETEKRFGHKEKNWPNPFKTIHFEAFGILGSDYYDKLVVLQALRKKFEHSQFFTTDMDARLFQPEDFKHVRNLIVGSGFGLSLQEKLQKNIPPFRDTYQTSAYLATLLALESKDCKQSLTQENLDEWLQARVFEIGRTQAFDLSLIKELEGSIGPDCFKSFDINAKSSLHPRPVPSIPSYKYPAVVTLILVLIIFLCLRFKEHWKWILAGTLIVTAYWAGVANLGSQWDEEPLAFFEGVSVWPTDFIRLIAVLMAIVVICYYNGNPFSRRSKGKLEENFDHIRDEFKYSDVPGSDKWKPFSQKEIFWNVVGCAALFVGLAFLILGTFGFPFTPFRGGISFWVDKVILIAFIVSFAISLHYSGVHLNDSIKLLTNFKGKEMKWPDAVKKKFFTDAVPGAVDPKSSGSPDFPDSMKAMLNGPISIRFIAQRTDTVDELIYFPFAILTLGVLSRARVFDNWDFPFGLASLFLYGTLYVLFKALKVQREAKKRKAELIQQLETQRIYYQAQGQNKEDGFLKLLIENTHNFKQGAFLPLAEHPFNRALLLPFSGFGAMALLEYIFLVV